MHTITFYSYKGGLGRTLVVANIAYYISLFGKNVFAVDFDLEAPGLHYKLGLGGGGGWKIEKGLVDYIHAFLLSKESEGLQGYVIGVEQKTSSEGSIHLLPAGAVPSSDYWQKLARINWHDLFYSENAKGIPFFLELKAQIAEEFAPDYLLIDARTGITEVGGVATTLLADTVVCLLLNNRENLEGAREVLRGIQRGPRLPGQAPVEIVPVVARLPELEDRRQEERILEEIRTFLNEEAPDLTSTLSVEEVLVLHADTELQLRESLRIGGAQGSEESVLLQDYLRLFTRLIPQEVIRTYLEPLIRRNVERVVRHEGRQFNDSFSKDAFQAVLERSVPDAVFFEIRNILNSEVIRSDCEYVITFKRPYPGMSPDYFIIHRALRFKVKNLLNRSTIFPIRVPYSSDNDLALAAWQHYSYLDLSVNDQKIAMKGGKNLFLDEPIPLAPQGEAAIFLQSEETCRIDAGQISYLQSTPVIGIEVNLINDYPEEITDLKVRMNHPAALETRVKGERYVLNRAFLPGQGFQALWKKRTENTTQADS